MSKNKFVTKSLKTDKELYDDFAKILKENDRRFSDGVRYMMRKAVRRGRL